ncbi:hypothetical protein HPB52_007383 [Rhipicephalus sanguineus]|uniref:Peptidase M13 C-terminal domain-containing protein n=1 Tax=Rhipicephalus sanguineus TaxID=34632 RepID=A0A9D4SQ29_RHISA|nr:hypothetical protein HPB52_007383 [Rhipicephalus sanguineus]
MECRPAPPVDKGGESPGTPGQGSVSTSQSGPLNAPPSASVELLSQPVCFAACSVVCIVCTIILIKTRQGPQPSASLAPCDGLACADPQRALESLLDYNVRPCDDFHAHVCARWTRSIRRENNFLEESVLQYMARVRDVLVPDPPTDAVSERFQEALDSGSTLLSECLAHMASGRLNMDQEVPLLFRKLRLAQVLNATSSLAAMTAGAEVSFRYGLNGLVRLRPQRVEATAVLYALRGIPLLTAFPMEAVLKHYVGRIVRVVSRAHQREYAEDLSARIVSLDNRVYASYRRRESPYRKVAYRKLHMEPPAIVAVVSGSMERLARRCNLSSVFLIARDYSNVARLLSFFHLDSSPETLFWYVAVQLLTDLLQFDYVKRFEIGIGRTDETAALRTCFLSMNAALSPVWTVMSRHLMAPGSNTSSSNGKPDPVAALFQGVKKVFKDGSNYLTDLGNDSTLERLRGSLDTVAVVTGAKLISDDAGVFHTSQPVPSGSGFLLDYVNVRAQVRRQSQFYPPDFAWDLSSMLEFKTRTFYVAEHDSLFIPTGLQTRHVFYAVGENDPWRLHNFGTLGAIMARELAKIFAPGARQGGDLDAFWTPEAVRSYESHMSCYMSFEPAQATKTAARASPWFQLELFLWLTSARVAYAALQEDYSTLPGRKADWKSVQQDFFLRFCLAACDSWNRTALTSREKCHRPLFDMPEFAAAFDCPLVSYMASKRRCQA